MIIDCQDEDYLKKLTILYVEDDEDTREQLCEFISRPVGTLLTASDGAEGLELFKAHLPDIVVTDILMPVMDGLTMSYEIRKIVLSVPIIVVTAFEETNYLKLAINIGIDKYVTKPVNSYMLLECLLECAHRLRAEEQLRLGHQRSIQAMWAKHHEIVATLAGGMAHDYNNLLHAILGFMTMAGEKLAEYNEGVEFKQHIEACFNQSLSLGNMLNILGNGCDAEIELAPVMPFIRSSIEQTLVGTPITLNCDYSEDLPAINYIKQHLHLVFIGITNNALEAMPSGGTLQLTAQKTTLTDSDPLPLIPGDYLHIKMTDSGSGISPDVLPDIFSPYFSTKQKSSKRGTGLSLALCHTIIIKHGGFISAESPPGSGATFHIWLPIPEQ